MSSSVTLRDTEGSEVGHRIPLGPGRRRRGSTFRQVDVSKVCIIRDSFVVLYYTAFFFSVNLVLLCSFLQVHLVSFRSFFFVFTLFVFLVSLLFIIIL